MNFRGPRPAGKNLRQRLVGGTGLIEIAPLKSTGDIEMMHLVQLLSQNRDKLPDRRGGTQPELQETRFITLIHE